MLVGPQMVGRIVSMPEPELIYVQMDAIPGKYITFITSKHSSEINLLNCIFVMSLCNTFVLNHNFISTADYYWIKKIQHAFEL